MHSSNSVIYVNSKFIISWYVKRYRDETLFIPRLKINKNGIIAQNYKHVESLGPTDNFLSISQQKTTPYVTPIQMFHLEVYIGPVIYNDPTVAREQNKVNFSLREI